MIDPTKLESLRPYVRGICYRMTGSLADAEDLVQETFLRALERPPAVDGELRPWVTTVAMNLSRDAYRRRRRAAYVGPWLPTPVEASDVVAYEPAETHARYDLVESASMAFLIALEALSARLRSVLLLRDVLDYSVEETARALTMTPGAVKVAHHRARVQMEAYDAAHRDFSLRAVEARTQSALAEFAAAISRGDVAALEALFTDDAVILSDGGGEFSAALAPVRGRAKVAKFLLGVSRFHAGGNFWLATINGLPALVGASPLAKERIAPRHVTILDVGADGLIRGVATVLATGKLADVNFPT